MKIKEVIVENEEQDMFGQSNRVGNDLRRVTFQQRMPSMVKMIHGALEANAGPFIKQMAAELGRDADVFRRDPEIFELADDLLTQEVMPQVSNILLSLDPVTISDEDALNNALTDHVANIRAESELWNYIEEVLGDDGGEDEAYACAMTIEGEIGSLLLKLVQQAYNETKLTEAFDQPYSIKWEEGEDSEAVDALATLGDGTYLSIMFNKEFGDYGDDLGDWAIEFHRNNSQEVSGEGDAQKVFATVLEAIRQFVKKYKPNTVTFSASKEPEPEMVKPGANANPESRAKLYNRLVHRYAGAMGYSAQQQEGNGKVTYLLKRARKGVAENFADGRHPEDKGDSKRLGVPTKASISTLRKVAKQGGRKGQLAHWMANMKSGRAKKK